MGAITPLVLWFHEQLLEITQGSLVVQVYWCSELFNARKVKNSTEFNGVRMTPNFRCVMSLKEPKVNQPRANFISNFSCLEEGTQGSISWTVKCPPHFRSLPTSYVPLRYLLWLLCGAGGMGGCRTYLAAGQAGPGALAHALLQAGQAPGSSPLTQDLP